MQILVANPRGFRAGVEHSFRAAERARDDFGAPELIVFRRPREPKRRPMLAAGACRAPVPPAIAKPATGAVA
jgi:hypothetical protein